MNDDVLNVGDKRCKSVNPETGNQCIMAEGHFGPHRTGGVYRHQSKERWVTKCPDGKCEYHEAFVHNPGHEECIHCGDVRPCPSSFTPAILYRESLDQLQCEHCADGKPCKSVHYLHARCHPKAGLWVAYHHDGYLMVMCKECNRSVADIAVAEEGTLVT